MLGVTGTHQVRSWGKARPVVGTAEAIAAPRPIAGPIADWQRLSAGAGTKRPRLHEWCYVELADLEASEYGGAAHDVWTRGLLIRRHIADGALAFFSTWCPAGTPIAKLVAVEGHRWAIEDRFRDHQERTRAGSQRNPIMAWLAQARFARHAGLRDAGDNPPSCQRNHRHAEKNPVETTAALARWSVQEIRRIATRLARRRIIPANIIAWSLWRRAHQAAAHAAHLRKAQL